MEAAIIAAWITGTAAVVAPSTAALTKWFLDRHRDHRPNSDQAFTCLALQDRVAMFEKCEELISQAQEVIDTTWGPDPPRYSDREKAALERYIAARKQAVEGPHHAKYREIFSETATRAARLADAAKYCSQHPNYKLKILTGYPQKRCVPDFLVADNCHIVFSNIHVQVKQRFLYLRCEPLATLLVEWFDDCWHAAHEPTAVPASPPHV